MQDINLSDDSVVEETQSKESIPTFNILLVSSTHENQDIYHVFYVTNIDGLTRQKFCPHCQQQAFDPKDINFSRNYESHVSLCKIKGGQIIKKVKLDEQPHPFCPHIYRNETYAYLLANEKEKQFKPTVNYITYDFETVERKVLKYYGKPTIVNEKKQEVIDEQGNKQIVCNSQWISELIPLSVASTIKLKWRYQYQQDKQYKQIETIFGPTAQKTIYFDLRYGFDFINQ
ncbi:MAG: hypothetical protein EZS28_009330 [Streblomastix strix]|uniref:Uncharacterized protein n=1 Tax=Streblomastix strix TaxID=222440 RepID=A0A5J4WKS5_9EUKA|nr:MAG: hypothetical protein EZS28_009330 [Streblomastix strix]